MSTVLFGTMPIPFKTFKGNPMFPYSKAVAPALQGHLESQTAFFNDVSKSLFETIQNLSQLNMQLAQTMIEECNHCAQHILSTDHPAPLIDAAASRALPASEKLRAYHQQLSRLAADSQVAMARISEEHVPKTSSTAKKLAEDVARTAAEETQRSMEKQKESMRSFTDPFAQHSNDKNNGRAGASLQSAREGNIQGGIPEKPPAKPK